MPIFGGGSPELNIPVSMDAGDAISEADKLRGKIDDVGKSAESASDGGGVLGKGLDILGKGALLAGGAVIGLGGGLLAAAKAAGEDKLSTDRLIQTINNSGAAYAGVTADVEALVAAGQKKAFQDTEIRDSLGLLVTQTKDVEEATRLQAIAMDLARSKGIGLEQATRLVMKADDESYKALAKLGIQIDENATSTQALAAIQQATAGSAQLYADSSAGAMERIQMSFGEAFESIGAAVLPLVSGPLQAFADWVQSPEVQEGITNVATQIGTFLVDAFNALKAVWEVVLPLIMPFAQAFADFFARMGEGQSLMDNLGQVFSDLGGAITAAWEVVGPALGDLIGKIIQWAIDSAPKILEQLGTWAVAFWEWLVEVWPTLVQNLGTLISDVWDWIVKEGPGILQKLGEWAIAFINWVAPMIPPFLLELGKIALGLLGWIAQTALDLAGKIVTEWIPGLWNWITGPGGVLEVLPPKLLEIAGAIWTWLTQVATDLGTKLVNEWIPAFWNWITGEEGVLAKIGEKLGEIWTKITNWVGDTAKNITEKVKEIGTNIVDGIKSGITGAWDAFVSWVTGLLGGIVDEVKKFFGITSPSKLMAKEVGQPLALGIGVGFADAWSGVARSIVGQVDQIAQMGGVRIPGGVDGGGFGRGGGIGGVGGGWGTGPVIPNGAIAPVYTMGGGNAPQIDVYVDGSRWNTTELAYRLGLEIRTRTART